MNSCKGCPYKDGVLSAFTCQNLSTPLGQDLSLPPPFEQLGFIKTQGDAWETKLKDNKWVKVQISYEEWQIDVWADTPKEYQEFISNLRDKGIHTLSYMPKLSIPFGKSTI